MEATVGSPLLTANEVLDGNLALRAQTGALQNSACVKCLLDLAENIPGLPGCAAGLANTLIESYEYGTQAGSGGINIGGAVSIAAGITGAALCFGSGGVIPSRLLTSATRAFQDLSKAQNAANITNNCSDCIEDGIEEAIEFANSIDPNDKTGPSGSGPSNFVDSMSQIPYFIRFENLDTASAPASCVTILDTLDKAIFDITSLQFTGFGFGDSSYSIFPPIIQPKFARDIDLRPNKNAILRISSSVDTSTGVLDWRFQTFDPKTMDLSPFIDDGCLPPNVNAPEGEGFIQFLVNLKIGAEDASKFTNKASIVFDNNSSIATPTWSNTIDLTSPVSRVIGLSKTQSDTNFVLNWNGNDFGGSGVQNYTVYVSSDGSDYSIWKLNTTGISDTFTGQVGRSYSFYSTATDSVGNVEMKSPVVEASTSIATSLRTAKDLPNFKVFQNVPNPLSRSTEITFLAPYSDIVKLEIVDQVGRTVHSESILSVVGLNSITWHPSHALSGIYYYRVTIGAHTRTRKLLIHN